MLENIKAIQKTNQHTARIINQMLMSKAYANENDAFVVLRASLKALRDRINPDEAIQLGGQLPALLRGFYFEGWKYGGPKNTARNKNTFLSDIKLYLHGHQEINLDKAVPIALKAILDAIDQGEAIQVLHSLPRDIQELCPE